jgi:nitrogen fixation/metabolism regulation signal transduction histidine kinase
MIETNELTSFPAVSSSSAFSSRDKPSFSLAELPTAYSRLREATGHLESECFMLHQRLKSVNTQLNLAERILSQLEQAVLFVNVEGYIKTYNPSSEKILKIPQDRALFSLYWNHFTDEFFGFSMRRALIKFQVQKVHHLQIHRRSYEVRTSCVRRKGMAEEQGILLCIRF